MLRTRGGRVFAAVFSLAAAFATAPSYAQQQDRTDDGRTGRARPRRQGAPEARDREAPPPARPDFAPAEPDHPSGPPRYLERRGHRWRGNARRHRRPRYYYDDYTYRFGVPYDYDSYEYALEQAYRQGLADGRNYERFEIQAERGLATYQRAMDEGEGAFVAGEYGRAAREFLLAATLNQGDPASRISAAHAHMALSDYKPAYRLLRRAFELQPKLIYLPMDIRNAYGRRADFEAHCASLTRATQNDPENRDLWFLLGYCHYYSADMPKAADALARAARLRPEDELLARFAQLSGLSARSKRQVPPEKATPPPRKEL